MAIHLSSTLRCYNHPHRQATRRCGRCATSYCDECLQPVNGQLLCPSCRQELEKARELERAEYVPLRERIRSKLTELGVWLAIIAVVGGLVLFVGRQAFSRPLTEEELNRIRDAFEMQMGDINWLVARRGATVLSVTSEQPGYPASLSMDERVGTEFPGWRSAEGRYPQEIVYDLGGPRPVRRVRVMVSSDAPKDSWARGIEIYRSDDLNGSWKLVARAELPNDEQSDIAEFPVPEDENASGPIGAQATRYIKVVILSNWGNPGFVSLGEVQASGT